MQITSVNDIVSGIEKIGKVNNAGEKESFSGILNNAIESAKETDAQAQQGNIELLTGENDSIHTAMIESEKAELVLSLAIQIRNKVIDAYNEIMRMQI